MTCRSTCMNSSKMPVIYITCVLYLVISELSALTCPPVNIPNGIAVPEARGQVLKFFCNKGFYRLGFKKARCKLTGWSKPPPFCYAPGCSLDHSLTNGNITSYGTFLMTLSCNEGYILTGFDAMYCNGSSWSSPLPECKIPADIDVCDFEYDTLCGWSQDKEDDFDWAWHKGQTLTGWTGPNYDHTYQNDEGHYLYLEMSPPRMRGDVARLISPKYNSSKSDKCFSLWYHMLGPDGLDEVGTLKVIFKDLVTDEQTTLLEIRGNQGESWKYGEVFIEKTNGSFQIIIEGRREKTYVGDIAVDDFRFFNCTVSQSTSGAPVTVEGEEDTTYSEPRTTIVDFQTIDTTYLRPKTLTEASGVSITKSFPSVLPLTVSQKLFPSISVMKSETEFQKTTNLETKTIKYTISDIQNKKHLSTDYQTDMTKADITTLSNILTSDKNRNENSLTLSVTGSANKTFLYARRSRKTSFAMITGSRRTSTLRSTGSEGASTYTIRESEGIFNISRLTTVLNVSQQKHTKYNLKTGDLSEHSIQNKTLIIVISVCTICVSGIVVILIIFICRKRKLHDNNPLEEMKTHFVYKKSIDLTLSRENMSEDVVCNQGVILPIRDLL